MNRVRVALALAVALAVGGAVWATRSMAAANQPSSAGADRSVSCYEHGDFISDAHERRALRTAPESARRTSAHVLTVIYRSGVQRFVDKRPEAVELDRFHWAYCGYVAALRAHLIGLEDGSLFTGKLLLDRSGRQLDAGATVHPSPDGKLFLAASQEDGDELEQWVISDLAGRRLWVGKSGITKIENKIEVASLEFEAPRWIGDDAIRVAAICDDSKGTKGEATLARDGKTWRWKGDLKCGA